jgi:RHS repeat-associated protein
MFARPYRPEVGRFLTQDRFASASQDLLLQSDPLTQNRYAFSGGNPVNNVEFDGHCPRAGDNGPCLVQGNSAAAKRHNKRAFAVGAKLDAAANKGAVTAEKERAARQAELNRRAAVNQDSRPATKAVWQYRYCPYGCGPDRQSDPDDLPAFIKVLQDPPNDLKGWASLLAGADCSVLQYALHGDRACDAVEQIADKREFARGGPAMFSAVETLSLFTPVGLEVRGATTTVRAATPAARSLLRRLGPRPAATTP